jgi:hypothetical protein
VLNAHQETPQFMRIAALIFILTIVFSAIGYIFWHQEVQYLLPTPLPKNYKAVLPDEAIKLDATLTSAKQSKPKLFHFFNPDCPCSRFNLKHFLVLKRKYSNEIDFYAVITNSEKLASAKEMLDKDIPVLVDNEEELAKACGVYSTPQAALLQKDNKLFFRGNYNRSRYCTNKDSNFVQMALDSLVAKKNPPHFSELATDSYGCVLSQNEDPLTFP